MEDFAKRENQFLQKVRTLEQLLQEATTKSSQEATDHTRQMDEFSSKISTLTQRVHADELEQSALKVRGHLLGLFFFCFQRILNLKFSPHSEIFRPPNLARKPLITS